MVKPAMPYLDIIADAADLSPGQPIACYQVSGEYAMVHAGAAAGIYDLKTMAFESIEGMVRAGMCLLLTSFFQYESYSERVRGYDYPLIFHARLFGMVVVRRSQLSCIVLYKHVNTKGSVVPFKLELP